MIVDAHTHLGDFPVFNVKLDAKGLIEAMDRSGVDHSVLFSLPNELTLEAVKKFPDRLSGLVWIDPKEGEKALRDIEIGIEDWGFRGLKLHPLLDSYLPDSEILDPVMDLAERRKVPTLFHCGHPPWSLPWHFGNLADRYPGVRIILGHMGHGHIVYINGALDVARRHENIYLETSGMPMHSKIKEAVETIGVDRVMYGSDAPFGHPAFEIEKVMVSGLREDELERVLSVNAMEVFKIRLTREGCSAHPGRREPSSLSR